MKCYYCAKLVRYEENPAQGTCILRELDAHGWSAAEHAPARCASTRTPAPVRLVEAAKRVIDLYDEDQMDSLGFAARRMTAMTALRAALAEVDRG